MSEEHDELLEAYGELDLALRKVVTLEGLEVGMVTDWVTVAAVQGFDNEGEPHSVTLTLSPPVLGSTVAPLYRLIGLLDVALNELRFQISAPYYGDVE
jgi:hypothetical protein